MVSNTYGVSISLLALLACTSPASAKELEVALEGRVVDRDGKPVQDAGIHLAVSDNWATITRGRGRIQHEPQYLGVSGGDGLFRVTAARRDVFRFESVVIAIAPKEKRLGVDWQEAQSFVVTEDGSRESAVANLGKPEKAGKPRVLRLSPDLPIVGRIIGPEGEPAAGVRVRVANVQQMRMDDLSDYVKTAKRNNPRDYDQARRDNQEKSFFGERGRRDGFGSLLTATTDKDGKFTLWGIGSNRVAWLIIDDAGVVNERVLVRTEEGQVIGIRDGDAVFRFYPARFEHTALKPMQVEGRVIDHKTGKPLAGVVIENLYTVTGTRTQGTCLAVSDDQGRYQLTGLRADAKIILVASAHDTPHLPSIAQLDLTSNHNAVKHDWRLHRGVWIEGRVFDRESHRPIVSRVHYFAFNNNPHLATVTGFRGSLSYPARPLFSTNEEGEYRIPGLPGRGLVTLKTMFDEEGLYPINKGQEKIEGARGSGVWTTFPTLPDICRASMFHAVREINLDERKNHVRVDFPLTPSKTLTGRVVDPAGRPLTDFMYAGHQEMGFYLAPTKGPTFNVFQYDPTFERRLTFWHRERKLAGTLVLRGEQPDTIDVSLQPQGVITGRVVDDDGKPMKGVVLQVAPLGEPNSPIWISPLPEPNYTTDVDGRFRIEGAAPGLKYNLVTAQGFQVVVNASAKSGQITRLGDLKLKPL